MGTHPSSEFDLSRSGVLGHVACEGDELRFCGHLSAEAQDVRGGCSDWPGLPFQLFERDHRLGWLALPYEGVLGRKIQALSHSGQNSLFGKPGESFGCRGRCRPFQILRSEQGVPRRLGLAQRDFGRAALRMLLGLQLAHSSIMPFSVHFVPLISMFY